ncbi:LytTR family DNA-binding domain-containing protein [Pontibacillus salicampi]|uniref:LytTR family DNA-binding domain-containing protein n=1 Tax=Pontibacillus salicampi TaxID=1449801 RepID=A0ABV6LMM2_9BACI
MKLGLVCDNQIRQELVEKCKALGIEMYTNADVYLVQEGLHHGFLPCIVFDPNRIEDVVRMLPNLVATSASSKMVGMIEEEYYVIHQEDILYLEAMDSYVHCHTADEVFRLKERLFQLEARLPSDRFVKVSRSFIVNIDAVVKIIPWFNRRLLLQFGHSKKEVEVSKSYVGAFKEFLGMK